MNLIKKLKRKVSRIKQVKEHKKTSDFASKKKLYKKELGIKAYFTPSFLKKNKLKLGIGYQAPKEEQLVTKWVKNPDIDKGTFKSRINILKKAIGGKSPKKTIPVVGVAKTNRVKTYIYGGSLGKELWTQDKRAILTTSKSVKANKKKIK